MWVFSSCISSHSSSAYLSLHATVPKQRFLTSAGGEGQQWVAEEAAMVMESLFTITSSSERGWQAVACATATITLLQSASIVHFCIFQTLKPQSHPLLLHSKLLCHLRLDVHLLARGILLFTANGIVVAELVRILGDVLLPKFTYWFLVGNKGMNCIGVLYGLHSHNPYQQHTPLQPTG